MERFFGIAKLHYGTAKARYIGLTRNKNATVQRSLDIMTLKRILFILLTLMTCSGFIFSPAWKSHVPDEFKSFGNPDVIYLVDGTHFFGPSGINEAFVVYSLSDDVLKKIEEGGLNYLQSIGSTIKYKELQVNYEKSKGNPKLTSKEERTNRLQYRNDAIGLYKDWQATPVKWEEGWNTNFGIHHSFRHEFCQGISICSFYGDKIIIPQSFKTDEVLKNLTLEDINFTDEIKPEYIQMINKIINSPDSYYAYGEFGVFIISPPQRKMFLLYRA